MSLAMARTRPRLTHSIVAFVGPEFGVLTSEDRDLLWTRFGVPVYEQLRGLGRELLAAECDAHEGLHIREEDAVFEQGDELLMTSLTNLSNPVLRLRTGLRGKITTKLCGCGETGSRLVELERVSSQQAVLP
jgi:phenylacetate-coenzyme A ligase PaaK-like adenylate-forming protein